MFTKGFPVPLASCSKMGSRLLSQPQGSSSGYLLGDIGHVHVAFNTPSMKWFKWEKIVSSCFFSVLLPTKNLIYTQMQNVMCFGSQWCWKLSPQTPFSTQQFHKIKVKHPWVMCCQNFLPSKKMCHLSRKGGVFLSLLEILRMGEPRNLGFDAVVARDHIEGHLWGGGGGTDIVVIFKMGWFLSLIYHNASDQRDI